MSTRYFLFQYDSARSYEVRGKHWKNPSKTELAFEQWLIANRVCVSITGGYEVKRDNWVCDQWRVGVWKMGKNFIFETDYFTGTGHRVNPYSKTDPRYKYETPKATTPHVAGIFHSLALDAQSACESFTEWCGSFGYENDSIKAFNAYQACEKTRHDLLRVFTRAQLQEITDLLQDY